MTLAVCLLSADRPDYTADTVSSFVEHALTDDHLLLHADDGSATSSNCLIAEAAGFDTVYEAHHRAGPLLAVRAMWNEALARGATHILHLENDWEFCGPIPDIGPAVQCARLYGERKAKAGPRQQTGPHRMGTKDKISWLDMVPNIGWQSGVAHWAGPPSITHAYLLADAAHRARHFKDLSLILNNLQTVRPRENIVWHIGDQTTPGAKFNA